MRTREEYEVTAMLLDRRYHSTTHTFRVKSTNDIDWEDGRHIDADTLQVVPLDEWQARRNRNFKEMAK